MKYTLYTLLAMVLMVSACEKEKQSYALNNPCDKAVHVRFYENKDDYYTNNNIIYSTIIAPGETKEIPLDNFPIRASTYVECYSEDFKLHSWPDELRHAVVRSKTTKTSNTDQVSFAAAVGDRAVPGIFFADRTGSYWKAVSKNGVMVTGNEHTMTLRKNQTFTIDNGTSHVESYYWVYRDTYPFGVSAASMLVYGDTVLSLVQGEEIDFYHTSYYYYPHPTVGSDSIVVIFYDGDELLFKRVNYL